LAAAYAARGDAVTAAVLVGGWFNII